ncbi:non-ribosomal peptide synthetase [Amycolatopsis sp. cmx-8-4]|uniref:non-ribosomal peptide synthetase n=1 Tax=Amycolatopsis sp. cmx-8-4 TaxID=2790947 RepID=UPI00397C00B7
MRTFTGKGPGQDVEVPARAGVTSKEEALWLLDRLVPGSGVNTVAVRFEVPVALDPVVLAEAARLVQRRHHGLRRVFHDEGTRLTAEVLPASAVTLDVSTVDTSRELVDARVAGFAAAPLEIGGTPPIRLAHFRCPDGDVVVVSAHHLVFDTISAAVFFTELAKAYEALAVGRSCPAVLAAEVRATPDVVPTETGIAYWREHLTGFDATALGLSVGTPEAAGSVLDGDFVEHRLSREALAALDRLRRELRAPDAVVHMAAYYLLLARHGAGPDLVVGTPVNTRPPHAQGAIGYHVNVLPLRVGVEFGAGFADLVARTRSVYFDALAHADVPVDLLLPELPRAGSDWRSTIFRHLFNYQPGGGLPRFGIGGVHTRGVSVENGTSKFDLELVVQADADETVLKGRYATGSHFRADVEALLRRYDALLVAAGADAQRPVGQLPLFSPADRAVVDAANKTRRPTRARTVLEAVADHVATQPAAVAVRDGERAVTYRELWLTAQATADRLRGQGTGPGDIVGLAGRRGPELVAAVFGCWLIGAAYLPIDPDHPAHRVEHQLADSGARVLLVGVGVSLDADGRTVLPLPAITADGPAVPDTLVVEGDEADDACAYLIYTSGSTGKPKGTVLAHRNLANLVTHFRGETGLGPGDGGLWMTTFAFDMSVMDLFLPLYAGATLVVAPDEARTDGRALRAVLAEHRVDFLQATPTTWRLVLDDVADLLAGVKVVCGGEPMPPALLRRLVATGCELRNLYGPTETCVWSTAARLTSPDDPIVVGRPIRNTTVFIADDAGRELPPGVHGELCIAGGGVAIGYHNRPELTADKFREHPVHGRFYRTGDQGRWRHDGTCELVGRVDRQIKLRGNRIELGEVEAVLAEHPEVAGVAVVLVGEPSAGGILVAFVEGPFVEGSESPGLADRLWQHARAQLPRAAVPHEFVTIDRLPTTVTEKIDYPALTRLAADRRAAAGEEPGSPAADGDLLDTLIGLWAGLLGRQDVEADTNFFVVGGHSLLGVQLVQHVEDLTGVGLKLTDVFSMPTPGQLADHVRDLLRTP